MGYTAQPGNQANIEYFFRLLYNCFHGACNSAINTDAFIALLSQVWNWIIIIGYLLAVIGLFIIVYCTMRLFELRRVEREYYSTLLVAPSEEGGAHPRWNHIADLAGSNNPSEWREAIIEADIMLEDVLTNAGYEGAGVGEKLMAADPSHFRTLQDAWEAHKVRNQIAHEGSAFNISDTLVHRTIGRYESVFRELKVI